MKTNANGVPYATYRIYDCQGLDCQENEKQRVTYYVLYNPSSHSMAP